MTTPDPCFVCNDPLPEKGSYPICSECNYAYHIGPCSGLSKPKKNWTCHVCLVSANRDGGGAQKQKRDQEKAFASVLLDINKKLADLPEIRSKVETLMQMQETVKDMEASMQHLSNTYDDVLKGVKEQSTEIAMLKAKIQEIQAGNAHLDVLKLQQQINSLEQYSRRQNIEIHGLPQTANENLMDKINALAADLKLAHLTDSDIEGLHRLPQKRDRIPAVLVRFASRTTRDQWMAQKSNMRAAKSNVYFLDNLTAQNKKLLWMMKQRCAEMQYEYAWQDNGKLLARKSDGQRAIRIECEADLDKIR